MVSEKGVSTDPAKIESLKEWLRPTNISLHELTKKRKQFAWTDKCEEGFPKLKQKLTEAPVLAYPRPECQFILDTDVSDIEIGAVLSQLIEGEETVIACATRSLSKPERC